MISSEMCCGAKHPYDEQDWKYAAKLFPAGSQIVRCEYDSDDVVAVARKTKAGYEVVVANISGQTQVVDVAIAGHKKQLSLAELDIQKIIPQR